MMPRIWIRCFIVSAVIAAVAPAFSMTLAAPGPEGQAVDLSAIEMERVLEADDSTINDYIQTVPMRTVDGFSDRLLYVFSHPQIAIFYLRASISWFIGLFMATILVGYLGARDFRKAQQGHPADARTTRG